MCWYLGIDRALECFSAYLVLRLRGGRSFGFEVRDCGCVAPAGLLGVVLVGRWCLSHVSLVLQHNYCEWYMLTIVVLVYFSVDSLSGFLVSVRLDSFTGDGGVDSVKRQSYFSVDDWLHHTLHQHLSYVARPYAGKMIRRSSQRPC